MNTKTVYIYDKNGVFVESYMCQESPLEPGIFITPENSTPIEPPLIPIGSAAVFSNGEWSVFSIPTPTPPVIAPPTPAELQAELVASAGIAMAKLDVSISRILRKGIAVPADINAYGDALREIFIGKDTTSTTLPAAPTDYPAGT